MPEISIKFDDLEVQKTLQSLGDAFKNTKKPLTEAGNDLLDFYGKKVFKTQGGASGAKWKPLSATTLKMRAERTGHYAKTPKARGKILIWTGALQKGFVKKVSRTKLIIKNNVKYFKFHQRATGRPPQRKMLTINREVITIVIKIFNKHIVKALK